MKVYLKTYGCTFNQADSDTMKGVLLSHGCTLVDSENEADVVVINSCTVKQPTENRIIHKIQGLAKDGKPLVVAGCIPSANKRLIKKIVPLAPIVDVNSISHVFDAVQAAANREVVEFSSASCSRLSLPKLREGKIARIPIADGCLGRCAYCQTKLSRGNLRSYPEEQILCEFRKCVEQGCKEIQLTAQDTGAYGLDMKTNLPALLKKVVEIPGDFIVRVGMMNPEHALKFLPELIEVFKNKKIKRFIHIPVQSGNNQVLKDMNRKYTVEEFAHLVKEVRKALPGISISTDIIVGFPTETKNAFEDTRKLVEELKFEVLNLSKFGPRPGTVAANLKQLPCEEINRRSRSIAEIQTKNREHQAQGAFFVSVF